MFDGWRIIASVTLFATLFDIYLNHFTFPSCNVILPSNVNSKAEIFADFEDNPQDLTAILVSNLLLSGTDSSFVDVFFRDFFMSQFLSVSFL